MPRSDEDYILRSAFNQYAPGGAAGQMADKFRGATGPAGDGFVQWGNIIENWGIVRLSLQEQLPEIPAGSVNTISVEFAKSYVDHTPVMSFVCSDTPGQQPTLNELTMTGFTVTGVGTVHWYAIGS